MNHAALAAGNKFAPSTSIDSINNAGGKSRRIGKRKRKAGPELVCADESCRRASSVVCCGSTFCLTHFHCTDHALHPERSKVVDKKQYKNDYDKWLEVSLVCVCVCVSVAYAKCSDVSSC